MWRRDRRLHQLFTDCPSVRRSVAHNTTSSQVYYFQYLLVVLIFRNEATCRGGSGLVGVGRRRRRRQGRREDSTKLKMIRAFLLVVISAYRAGTVESSTISN